MVRSFLDGFEVLAISKNIINKALQNRKVKKIKISQIVMVLGWVKFLTPKFYFRTVRILIKYTS
jgi:hypothetical protein